MIKSVRIEPINLTNDESTINVMMELDTAESVSVPYIVKDQDGSITNSSMSLKEAFDTKHEVSIYDKFYIGYIGG